MRNWIRWTLHTKNFIIFFIHRHFFWKFCIYIVIALNSTILSLCYQIIGLKIFYLILIGYLNWKVTLPEVHVNFALDSCSNASLSHPMVRAASVVEVVVVFGGHLLPMLLSVTLEISCPELTSLFLKEKDNRKLLTFSMGCYHPFAFFTFNSCVMNTVFSFPTIQPTSSTDDTFFIWTLPSKSITLPIPIFTKFTKMPKEKDIQDISEL